MQKKLIFLGLLLISFGVTNVLVAQVYFTRTGTATFVSDAPLEMISASTEYLNGALDLTDNRFAFRIENKSFIGFNSALQQEHFYENYIETDKFKYSIFQGKIIEKIDMSSTNSQTVRAKGTLSIHGVDQERIIKAHLIIEEGVIHVSCTFEVPLEDHDISIPNVVHQKIAEIIDVEVTAALNLKTD